MKRMHTFRVRMRSFVLFRKHISPNWALH
uniref:Uncharacterized protein n=1 Tax=Arundo donax TaxID=35708 RepID=A0A0A9F4H7_ARUDO